MVTREDFIAYLERLLKPDLVRDYCPNGLQIEGRPMVRSIVTGVTACQSVIEKTIQLGADVLLVHHGFFWKGESPCITGMKQRRIAALIKNDINLIAYHLPLDIHPELGNNVVFGQRLGWNSQKSFTVNGIQDLLCTTALDRPLSAIQLENLLSKQLERRPLHIEGRADSITHIAWCTGAAQDLIEEAIRLGCDAFISGEISERTVHTARENGIHYFACGHHASERYGIQALGKHLAERFHLEHHFADINNPV